jgi:hypothetical protein
MQEQKPVQPEEPWVLEPWKWKSLRHVPRQQQRVTPLDVEEASRFVALLKIGQ